MRMPEFLDWTPEERRAVLAVLLFTGGGGVLIELGRRFPDWTPELKLVQALDGAVADSAARDTLGVDEAVADSGYHAASLGGGRSPTESPAARSGRHVPADADAPAMPIDINRADAGELTRLPGVGPKLAERIVADRAALGPYRTLADLDRVKGVGPALLQKLAGMAVIDTASRPASRKPS